MILTALAWDPVLSGEDTGVWPPLYTNVLLWCMGVGAQMDIFKGVNTNNVVVAACCLYTPIKRRWNTDTHMHIMDWVPVGLRSWKANNTAE